MIKRVLVSLGLAGALLAGLGGAAAAQPAAHTIAPAPTMAPANWMTDDDTILTVTAGEDVWPGVWVMQFGPWGCRYAVNGHWHSGQDGPHYVRLHYGDSFTTEYCGRMPWLLVRL